MTCECVKHTFVTELMMSISQMQAHSNNDNLHGGAAAADQMIWYPAFVDFELVLTFARVSNNNEYGNKHVCDVSSNSPLGRLTAQDNSCHTLAQKPAARRAEIIGDNISLFVSISLHKS